MGITFSLALLLVIFAYLAQAPGTAAKLGLANARLDLRLKSLTGYALALMLLSLGFFLAGVPLDSSVTETAVTPATTIATPAADISQNDTTLPTALITPTQTISETIATLDIEQTPSSGSFGGPPPGQEENEAETSPETGPATPEATPLPTDSPTPVTFTPTATAMATPTASATPTITPTPIEGPTAVLNLGGGVVWLYRSPGAQTLIVLHDEEVVLLRNGYANRAGIIWREVSTGDGTTGWVEESFLTIVEEAEND